MAASPRDASADGRPSLAARLNDLAVTRSDCFRLFASAASWCIDAGVGQVGELGCGQQVLVAEIVGLAPATVLLVAAGGLDAGWPGQLGCPSREATRGFGRDSAGR